MEFDGKTALVTGSSREIGKAIALGLAEKGARVVVNHRDSAADAAEVADAIRKIGAQVLVVQADVTQRREVEAMAKKILAAFGTVDILVNNVGASTRVPFLQLTDEDWHQLFAINAHSCFYVTQTFIGGMVDRKWGRIINITGHASLRGSPHSAHVVAAKGAVMAFTRSIATEFARHGITCNNVAPAKTENNLERHRYYRDFSEEVQKEWFAQWDEAIPMKRGATLKELASLCVYLASSDAAYLTGQTYLVNGGMMYL